MNPTELSRENPSETWYIVKQTDGSCEILQSENSSAEEKSTEQWGPFASQGEAIARRVGLIRAGKCQPQ